MTAIRREKLKPAKSRKSLVNNFAGSLAIGPCRCKMSDHSIGAIAVQSFKPRSPFLTLDMVFRWKRSLRRIAARNLNLRLSSRTSFERKSKRKLANVFPTVRQHSGAPLARQRRNRVLRTCLEHAPAPLTASGLDMRTGHPARAGEPSSSGVSSSGAAHQR